MSFHQDEFHQRKKSPLPEDMDFYLVAFENSTMEIYNFYTVNLKWSDNKARKQLIKDLNYTLGKSKTGSFTVRIR
jgi:hypothetical protein